MIIIGKIMYIKKGGEWQNMGTQMSDMQEKMKEQVQGMRTAEIAEATKGLTADYKSLGDEMLDGIPTAVYEMHSQLDTKVEGVGSIVTITKFWIGKSDGLFHKEETNGEEARMKVKTTRIYEYDPSIKIEAPIP
jgi:ERCC4-type nuclease